MTKVDLIALGFVALTAFIGWKKGLIASALSLAGIVLGGWLGSRLAPQLLQDGTHSPYTPLAALAGAAVGAILFETLGTLVGSALRSRVRRQRMSTFDATGGLILGAFTGMAVVWVLGAVALLLPGQTDLRRGAQGSALLQRLNEFIPPTERAECAGTHRPVPLDHRPGRAGRGAGPAPRARRRRPPRCAERCARARDGLRSRRRRHRLGGEAGSDRDGRPRRRGTERTVVELQSGGRFPADVVAFDRRNDVAVLRVRDLGLRPLRLVSAKSGAAVAVLGFPENGPFTVTPARIGRTSMVLAEDAYGSGPVTRTITSLRGRVRHGDRARRQWTRRGQCRRRSSRLVSVPSEGSVFRQTLYASISRRRASRSRPATALLSRRAAPVPATGV